MINIHSPTHQKKLRPTQRLFICGLISLFNLLAFSPFSLAQNLSVSQALPSITAAQKLKIAKALPSSGVLDVVFISPVFVGDAFLHNWREEKQLYESATLAVFKVNPKLVYPRNAAEPVLYVGNQTAQRLNQGDKSGYVIALIPGDVDLSREPVWFGSAELPERVNKETIAKERERAEAARFQPFDPEHVAKVSTKPLKAQNLRDLLREPISELVMKFSPEEKHLAEAWRVPVTKR